jgi:hypothetical protein
LWQDKNSDHYAWEWAILQIFESGNDVYYCDERKALRPEDASYGDGGDVLSSSSLSEGSRLMFTW